MIETIAHGFAAGPGRRIVLPALGFLAVVLVLILLVIAGIVRELDDHARKDGLAHLEGGLQEMAIGLERTLVDYAAWDEAYDRLHRTVDLAWAHDDDNLGASLLASHGFDAVMLFDAAGVERYGVGPAGLAAAPLSAGFDAGLASLIEQARLPTVRPSRPAVGYATTAGVPALLAAGRITGDEADDAPAAGASLLVFAILLTPERLATLGHTERLNDLRVAGDPEDAAEEPRLVLFHADGGGAAVLRWQPEPIGREIVSTILPLMATCLLTMVVALMLLLRQVTRSERLVQAQARALETAHANALHLALHDEVTGLANRRHLTGRLRDHLAAGHAAAVLFLDLDRFKAINDTHGHDVGDLVLRTVAGRLSALAADGLAARLGGDEFVLLLPAAPVADLAAVADRLIRAVAAPIPHGDGAVAVGVSVGIARAPDDGSDASDLLRRADLALARAKAAGRGTHRFYAADLEDGAGQSADAGRPSVSPERAGQERTGQDRAAPVARRPGGLAPFTPRPA